MRQELTIQASIFDLFAGHEIGRDSGKDGARLPFGAPSLSNFFPASIFLPKMQGSAPDLGTCRAS